VLDGDGRDAVPVTVEALDARGRHVSTANFPVQFAINGGRIIGVGNGDANSHEPEKGKARSLYNGYAQAIVQSERRGAGTLLIKASSSGLRSAATSIQVRALPPVLFVS
jgi:beta-galactosidase